MIDKATGENNALWNTAKSRNVPTELLRRASMQAQEGKNKALLEASGKDLERTTQNTLMNANIDAQNNQTLNQVQLQNLQAKIADNAQRGQISSQLLTQGGNIASQFGMSKVQSGMRNNKAALLKYLLKNNPNALAQFLSGGNMTNFDIDTIADRTAKETKI